MRGPTRLPSVVVVVATVAALVSGCADAASSDATGSSTLRLAATSSSGAAEGAVEGVVTSVTDGDTLRVTTAGGAAERVRLIGVDTPETHDPRRAVECFGREAAARTAALVPPGTRVRLDRDVETRDRYGRLLAYVYRTVDGLFVNEELVRGGWAVPYRYPPNVRFADRFSALGREAREQDRGLWGACGGADTPAGSNAGASAQGRSSTATTSATNGGSACDANYAGACVRVSGTDLDCPDVGVRRFQVVGADPHGFDRDHDGIACE